MKLPVGVPGWAYAALAAALLAAGAYGGWTVQGWQYEARIGAQARADLKAVADAVVKAHERAETERIQNEKLSQDLAAARRRYAALQDQLELATLGSGNCSGNPFGPDFERLWNASATDTAAAPGPAADRGDAALPGGAADATPGLPDPTP